jgi:PD-(D/E)XK endonuclease
MTLDHPKAIGDRSVLAVMMALQETGVPFAIPFGENTRYDLIVEVGSALVRVQCKTGRLRGGAVWFRTSSSYAHHLSKRHLSRDYLQDVDYFAVHCPETGGVYLIPITQLQTRTQAALRVDSPRNQQRRRIRLAADYEIAKVSVVAA